MPKQDLVEEIFAKLQTLIKAQAWDEALELSENFRRKQDLGVRERDFLIMEAACWRRKGDHTKSRELYTQLQRLFDPPDPRLADVYSGLAESYTVTGDFRTAYEKAQLAEQIIDFSGLDDPDLNVRVRNQLANATSYINIHLGLELYAELLKEAEATNQPTSAIANLYFQYGNVLFRNGDFRETIDLLEKALKMAVASDALKTVADCKRKLPLAKILAGDVDYTLNGLVDLDYAQEIYQALGDRGYHYSFTERGELLKSLGRYEEAQHAYKKSLWGARDIGDNIRIAHSLLGLYELERVLGIRRGKVPQTAQIKEAFERYRIYNYHWGIIHCLISRSLIQTELGKRDGILNDVLKFISESKQADFHNEQLLIKKLLPLGLKAAQDEKQLLNWS